jgi:hypothetical protein
MVAALQKVVCSLLDSTYPVALADMSGTADRAIGIDCDWLKGARLMESDAHHIVAQQRFLVLDFLQKHLERISCIKHSHRSGIPIRNRNVLEPALLHPRPNFVQPIARLANDNIPRHHQ